MQSSGRPRLLRYLAFLSVLLLIAGESSCGFWDTPIGENEITVVVNVEGLSPNITSLHVVSTLNGTTAQQAQDVMGRLDRFAFALPLSSTGHMVIKAVAHSPDQCVVATGQIELDIAPPPPTRYEVTLSLAAAGGAKSCALTVQVLGKGTITSQPAGIMCVGTGAPGVSTQVGSPGTELEFAL